MEVKADERPRTLPAGSWGLGLGLRTRSGRPECQRMERTPRRVLVTGASSGIGRALTLELFSAGFDVAMMSRREREMRDLADRAILHQREAKVFSVDLANRGSTDAALSSLLSEWPSLDAVILNAGVSELTPLSDSTTAAFDRVMELDLTSNFRILRRLVPSVPKGGRIVAVASILGRFGIPDAHGYCSAKAGLCGLVRALALDLAPRDIAVNAVLPGWVATPMADDAIAKQAPAMGMDTHAAREFFEKAMPIGRFLQPVEIAKTILFLLSAKAAGLTGQALNHCGGTLA